MVIPSNKNTSTKVSEKLSKYEDLQIEIIRIWKMETEIITVVLGALRVNIRRQCSLVDDKITASCQTNRIGLLGIILKLTLLTINNENEP